MEPITRKEKFLAKAGGQDVGDLEPVTREEYFISKIKGGGGGGGALPDGGAKGDILAKKSGADGDAEWVSPPASIDAYTKTETDALLDDKADNADTYTKTEVDALIPDVSDLATKTELSEGLAEKSALNVSTISTAGGGSEVHAIVSQGDDEVSVNYYKTGTELPDYVNLNVNGDGFRLPTAEYVNNLADTVPFIANYGQTTYADVTAAIDADRAIVVNFSNNKNLICVTYATYTAGQNVTMSGIYKEDSDVSLATITLTPANAWSIAHTAMQDKLTSGTNIRTINNFSLLGSGDIRVATSFPVRFGDKTLSEVLDACRVGSIINVYEDRGGTRYDYYCTSFYYDKTNQKLYLYYNFESGGAQTIDGFSIDSTNHWNHLLPFNTQKKLVSGTDIKTVNNQSLLGSGNLDIGGGGTVDTSMSDTSENAVQNKVIKSYVDEKTGNLSNLATTEKTNLVGAVNEVNGKAGFHVAGGQERWVGTYTDENNVTYQVYSKQIYIPALPATAGITAYEHGIDNIKQILDIYGSTTDGFVLNAPRQTVTDNITIYQASKSASNKTFSIEVGKDRSNKKAYVTVIYAKNN